MRKILVLILVFGLASAANAMLIKVDDQVGDSFEVDVKTTITVVSEDSSSWLGYIIVEEGGAGAIENAAKLDAAGDLGVASAYAEAGWGAGYTLTVASTSVPTNVVAGPQFDVSYTAGLGTAQISLFLDPEYEIPAASVAVEVVPEPMTVLLLGLGGLFLRRRK